MSSHDILLILAGSFLPNNLLALIFSKLFYPRRPKQPRADQGIFTKLAVWCGNQFGSPFNFALWAVIIGIWLWSGHIFHYNNTWQLLINTPTTIIELFAAILIQYVGNRIERRQEKSETYIIKLLERIETLEKERLSN